MARKFLTNLDLSQLEIQNVAAHKLASAPASPVTGQIYFDTTANRFYVWNGTAWGLVATNSDKLQGNDSTYHVSRANHTGTQLSSTISDLATTVKGYTLDSFAAPAVNVAMAGKTLTGLPAGAAAGQPVEYAQYQATKLSALQAPAANVAMAGFTLTGLPAAAANGQPVEYAQFNTAIANVSTGTEFKSPPAAVVATSNVSLTAPGTALNGYTFAAGDSILLTGQTTTSQNGIYVWNSATSLTRRSDSNSAGSLKGGAMIAVANTDNANGDSLWILASTGSITIDTTAQSWVKFQAGTSYSAAANGGLSLTSNAFAVVPATGVTVGASGVGADFTVVARKVTGTMGTSGTTVSVAHNLNNSAPLVVVRYGSAGATPGAQVEVDNVATDVNTVQFTFPTTPAANQYVYSIIG